MRAKKSHPCKELKNRPEIIFKFDLSPEVGFVDKVISFNNAIIYCIRTTIYFFFVPCAYLYTRLFILYNEGII